jgi:AraC-like DNA-binding protein
MTNRLLFFTVFVLLIIASPLRTHAENTSDYEKYKQKSFSYYQQRNYELAYYYLSLADSIGQVEHQNELQKSQKQYLDLQKQVNQVSDENNASQSEFTKNRKVTYGIFIFILIDVLGLFFFMYLQRQRTYLHLVKKNMEWAQTNALQPDIDKTQQPQQEAIQINQIDNSPKNIGAVNYREQDLLLRFIQLLKEEKIYLKSDITIQDVAQLLDANKYTLSKIINTCFHKSFPALINEYRIKEAINLLSNIRQSSVYTLEAIGEKSGFRSRQVFYMVFKKSTGITPNDFRKMRFSRDFLEEYEDRKT